MASDDNPGQDRLHFAVSHLCGVPATTFHVICNELPLCIADFDDRVDARRFAGLLHFAWENWPDVCDTDEVECLRKVQVGDYRFELSASWCEHFTDEKTVVLRMTEPTTENIVRFPMTAEMEENLDLITGVLSRANYFFHWNRPPPENLR